MPENKIDRRKGDGITAAKSKIGIAIGHGGEVEVYTGKLREGIIHAVVFKRVARARNATCPKIIFLRLRRSDYPDYRPISY